MAIAGGPIEPEEAVSAIRSGDRVMVGGFGLVGAPLTLIDALVESSDADELTIVSNNIGEPGRGLGKLLRQGRIKRGISSYFTSNPEAVAAVNAGEIEATLVPQAARSWPARRRAEEPDCGLRSPLQRDRDRIVHSKAFRRLKHKTQVFVAPEGDHYRTRLTHTLEVTQIARSVARALRLNEDLVEAIGLGHDLGHAPFGHIGEAVLDRCARARFGRGFRHWEHSLRVVDELERLYVPRNEARWLRRNALVALGNVGDQEDVPVLGRYTDDPEPALRATASRALARVARK